MDNNSNFTDTSKANVNADIFRDVKALLLQGHGSLNTKEWKKAEYFFDKVIEATPDTPEGYLGKLLAQLHLADEQGLATCKKNYTKLPLYETLMQKADVDLYNRIAAYGEGRFNAAGNSDGAKQSEISFLDKYKTQILAVCAVLLCVAVIAVIIPKNKGSGPVGELQQVANALTFQLSEDGSYYSVVQCDPFAYHVTIPEYFNDIPVKRISSYAFYNSSTLTEVSIPASVTMIDSFAFSECPKLTIRCAVSEAPDGWSALWQEDCQYWFSSPYTPPVHVGGSEGNPIEYTLSSDGQYYVASAGDATVINLFIPDSYNGLPVREIADFAFAGATSLAHVVISDSVEVIGESAFSGCSNLTGVSIPDRVSYVGDGAFAGCTSLGRIVLFDSIAHMGLGVFESCPMLEIFCTFDGALDGWSDGWNGGSTVYWGYSLGIESLTLELSSDGEYYVVSDWDGSADVVSIPDEYNGLPVREIGEDCFDEYNCRLTLYIPSTITYIHYYAFQITPKLMGVTVDPENEQYMSVDGNLYTKDGRVLVTYSGGKGDKEFTVPDGVEVIEHCAFQYAPYIERIVLPGSIKTLSYYAFSGCNALESINLPDGLATIEGHAFSGCPKLCDLTIPDTVEEIGYAAFAGSGISTLNISESLTRISSAAFDNCDNLAAITVDPANQVYTAVDGVLYSKDGKTLYIYPSGKTDESFAIPYGVEIVGGYAFCGNDYLMSVSIPSSVKQLREYAFEILPQMRVLYIPAGVEKVERDIVSPEVTVYCAAASKPDEWSDEWSNDCQVIWGYGGN